MPPSEQQQALAKARLKAVFSARAGIHNHNAKLFKAALAASAATATAHDTDTMFGLVTILDDPARANWLRQLGRTAGRHEELLLVEVPCPVEPTVETALVAAGLKRHTYGKAHGIWVYRGRAVASDIEALVSLVGDQVTPSQMSEPCEGRNLLGERYVSRLTASLDPQTTPETLSHPKEMVGRTDSEVRP